MPALLQVPRSAKQVTEDNDYALYRVLLFRRVVEQFKSEARSRGYQVHTLLSKAACIHKKVACERVSLPLFQQVQGLSLGLKFCCICICPK